MDDKSVHLRDEYPIYIREYPKTKIQSVNILNSPCESAVRRISFLDTG